MANDSSLITSTNPADGGELHRAAIGSTLPTDAIADLDAAFAGLGFTGDDGFVVSQNRSTEDKRAYGGDVVYSLQTEYGVSVQVTVYESQNAEVLKTVFGDDNVVTSAGTTTVLYNKKRLPRSVFVSDHITDQGLLRQVIPVGQVTEVGDITLVHTDILMYQLTITAYPDSDGNYMYEYRTVDAPVGG